MKHHRVLEYLALRLLLNAAVSLSDGSISFYIPFMNQGCSIWSTSFSSKYSTCAAGRSRSIQHSTSHAEPRPSHGWKVANTFKCNSPFPASEPSKIRKKVVDWQKKNVPTKSEDADWHKSKKVISSPALTRIVGPAHIVKMSRRAGPLHKHARCTPESDLKAITITSHLPSSLSSPKMNLFRTYSTMLTRNSDIFDFHTLVRSGQIWNLRLVKSGVNVKAKAIGFWVSSLRHQGRFHELPSDSSWFFALNHFESLRKAACCLSKSHPAMLWKRIPDPSRKAEHSPNRHEPGRKQQLCTNHSSEVMMYWFNLPTSFCCDTNPKQIRFPGFLFSWKVKLSYWIGFSMDVCNSISALLASCKNVIWIFSWAVLAGWWGGGAGENLLGSFLLQFWS